MSEEWLHYGAIGVLQALGREGNWWECEARDGGRVIKVGAEQVARYQAWLSLSESERHAALVDSAPEEKQP